MRKATGVKYWIKECDEAYSELIREKGFCEWCGNRAGMLQCSHVIPRTNKTLRWDIFNGLSLCYFCHIRVWHSDPLKAMRWFSEKYPERYSYLMENRNKIIKRIPEDYQILLKNLKERNLKALVTFGY